MNKAELRKTYREKRSSLIQEEVREKSLEIAHHFLTVMQDFDYKVLHTFLSIQKNKEVDTFILIEMLRTNFSNLKIIIPKTDFTSKTMQSFEFTAETAIQNNHLGIPEPINANFFTQKDDIGAVLVPLLVADKKGYRVGYGGGFYDIFLATLPEDTHKIGVSFFPPIIEIEDTEAHDIKLDYLILPERVIKF